MKNLNEKIKEQQEKLAKLMKEKKEIEQMQNDFFAQFLLKICDENLQFRNLILNEINENAKAKDKKKLSVIIERLSQAQDLNNTSDDFSS